MPHNIDTYDLFGDKLNHYDAMSTGALLEEGVAVIEKGGTVHFEAMGKNHYYRGHFPEMRESCLAHFKATVQIISEHNKL